MSFRRGESVKVENDPQIKIENACPICGEITTIPATKVGTYNCSKDHTWHVNHGGSKYYGAHINEEYPRMMTDDEFVDLARKASKTEEQFEQLMLHSGFRVEKSWVRN